VFSLFYSIPGLYWYDVLGSQISPVLVDQLVKCHYQMAIFASASLISPPFDRTIFSEVKDLRLHTPGAAAHDRDIQITKDWLNFTDRYVASSRGQPFFGFMFYDAMHSITHPDNFKGPFQPAWKYPRYEALSSNMDPTPFLNLYRNVTFFVDSLVGVVLTDLRNKRLLDSTIVIITGDHGQEFNENGKGYWGHNGNYSQAQLGVPLVIRWPNMTQGVFSHWTSHYDIVPTLMQQVFHCRNAIKDYSIGKSLFDTTPREWLVVGSKDNFGILEPDRITSVNYDRSFDITDRQLNEIQGARLNTKLFNEIFSSINTYYLK
jgi:membrane-anchored protein YejM (alkaline phosphatase superfamily)